MTKGLCCDIWEAVTRRLGWCERLKEKLMKLSRTARALQSFQEATKDMNISVFRGRKKKRRWSTWPDLWARTALTARILYNLKRREKRCSNLSAREVSVTEAEFLDRTGRKETHLFSVCQYTSFSPGDRQDCPSLELPVTQESLGTTDLQVAVARQDPLLEAWVPVSGRVHIPGANITIPIVHQHPRLLLSVSQPSAQPLLQSYTTASECIIRYQEEIIPKPQLKALLKASTLQIPIRNQWKWSCSAHSVLQGSV